MDGLTVGRIVNWVGADWATRYHKRHLMAFVVDVIDKDAGVVSLQAMRHDIAGLIFIEKVTYSESGEPNTWHWIEAA